MSKKIISQSFIKSLFDYKEGKECGLQFKAKYDDGIEFPSSDAMRLGQWFEYNCTGQKTKFGRIPEPDRLKPKKLTKAEIEKGLKQEEQVGALSKKFSDALIQAEAFKKMIAYHEYEILGTGVKLIDEKLGISGEIDIVVRKKGEDKVRFIDTKYSGLLDNKWDDMGWADESLEYKDKLMIQAVQYKMLGLANYGYIPEFYFWVFSSSNTEDRKNIKVVVDEGRYEEHKIIIENARAEYEKSKANGWIPRPNPKRCYECPISATCSHKVIDSPIEQIVYY